MPHHPFHAPGEQKPQHSEKRGYVLKTLEGPELFEVQEEVFYDEFEGSKSIVEQAIHLADCGHFIGLQCAAELASECGLCGASCCHHCGNTRCRHCLKILCPSCIRQLDGRPYCGSCRAWVFLRECGLKVLGNFHKLFSREFE